MNQIQLPAGFRDTILEECTKKNRIENTLNRVFESYGYEQIMTPAIEFYQTYAKAFHHLDERDMIKFFDKSQNILTLRMDMTVPIARAVTTRYQDKNGPFRLHYCANVYKVKSSLAGKRSVMTDCGVELIGLDAGSDLEVLTCALDGLEALNLKGYLLEIGTVRFFEEACRHADLGEQQRRTLADLIDRKSMVELKDYLNELPLRPTEKQFFLALPLLGGDQSILDTAYALSFAPSLKEIVVGLKKLAVQLNELGYGEHICFDLGKIAHLDYYTGIIFEGFVQGAGTSVLSGGRYDSLLKVFGCDLPACGFSFKVEELMDQIETTERKKKVQVVYGENKNLEAMKLAAALRKEHAVELVPGFADEVIVKEVDV